MLVVSSKADFYAKMCLPLLSLPSLNPAFLWRFVVCKMPPCQQSLQKCEKSEECVCLFFGMTADMNIAVKITHLCNMGTVVSATASLQEGCGFNSGSETFFVWMFSLWLLGFYPGSYHRNKKRMWGWFKPLRCLCEWKSLWPLWPFNKLASCPRCHLLCPFTAAIGPSRPPPPPNFQLLFQCPCFKVPPLFWLYSRKFRLHVVHPCRLVTL